MHLKSASGHGTQKPVEAMRRPMENNSQPGDVVYDPFVGSGTTIIAAQSSGRVCPRPRLRRPRGPAMGTHDGPARLAVGQLAPGGDSEIRGFCPCGPVPAVRVRDLTEKHLIDIEDRLGGSPLARYRLTAQQAAHPGAWGDLFAQRSDSAAEPVAAAAPSPIGMLQRATLN